MDEGQTADDATLIDASDLTISDMDSMGGGSPVEIHLVEICRMETPDNKEELLEKEKTVVYYNAMRKSTEREYEYGFRAMLQGTGGRLCRGHAQTPEGRAGTPFFDKILRKR